MRARPAAGCSSGDSGPTGGPGGSRSGGRWPRRLVRLGWLSLSAFWLGCDPGGELAQPGTLPPPSCPQVRCTGGVSFAADLAVTAADAARLELLLCRNNLCSTLHPSPSGTYFGCDFAGPLTAACRLDPSGGSLHLQGTFQGLMTNWAAGDTFTVRVGLPGAFPLLNLHQTIARYDETRPAGPDCPPLCRSATLQ